MDSFIAFLLCWWLLDLQYICRI